MIDSFESSVRISPNSEFFSFVDGDGSEFTYTYWQSRLIAAAFARRLQSLGMRSGDVVAVDLPNSPEFVFVALACAYGGFTMILLENSLPESDKLAQLLEVERSGINAACKVDMALANQMLSCVRNLPEDDSDIVRQIFASSRRSRSIMGESQDFIDDTVHFAERAAHLFDRSTLAVITFAGGKHDDSAGKNNAIKVVPLTWTHLLDAALVANEYLATGASRLWQERLPFNSFSSSGSKDLQAPTASAIIQCVLPLSKMEGFQPLLRSVVSKSYFRLHTGADPEFILRDAEYGLVTHVSVDDAALQDLLTVEEWRNDTMPGTTSRLSKYQCVLLVGRLKNPRTIKRAYDLGARIFAGYSLPQASGVIGASLITPDYQGGIAPIDAYEVRIIDPDEEGFGRVALRGPGVFDGYLNSNTPHTVDHFFITEDKAALYDGKVFFRNRFENMFVSAGQSIYPVEIADVLRHVSGVKSVHVFGVTDSRHGKLPVAVIERDNPALTPQVVETTTRPWFSSITVPISIFVFDQLPRTARGNLDRSAIEAIFTA